MLSIDLTTLIGWVIFAIINSITVVVTSRYTNRVLDKLVKPSEFVGDRDGRQKTRSSSN